ncbi:ArsR family transcriptional regulator [Kribbella capetownensis]|uniref:ArsR family transcriptional regulator n=1 Tax=Kribbella capetownensis TaxID=1572659 RepID=A0A4R0JMC3_9ACTN|nr:ArsR family transcriptional regulator [Kribbella capetownensis]TCC47527.1 ArsR family transcriptional regulator [Kribbella capetownensis]
MSGAVNGVPEFIRLVSHPLRWQLVTELARSDLRVRELVAAVDEPQNLVSYHLRLLRDGGLVASRRSSFDARDSYYHLDLDRCAEALADAGTSLHPALRMTPAPEEPPRRSSVLFICSGNSARSPIAEALLRHRAGNRVRVSSAGTWPKDRIHPHAVRVLREHYDIDIEEQAPRVLNPTLHSRFKRVITLCDKARETLSDNPPRAHWSIPDPSAGDDGRSSYSRFVSAAADIDDRVRHLLPSLKEDQP